MNIKMLSKRIKFYTALVAAKSASALLKLRGTTAGTSFPGLLANKIDKSFLAGTQLYCKKSIITVTGTNGKTTTSGLVASILDSNKQKILHNQKGANMPQGIATALAIGINPLKKADYFVLETDEAYLSKIYDKINADYLIVTNLFRDQLDRYGEVDATAKMIREAINKNSNLTLLLNADDITLKPLYTEKTFTYGFEDIVMAENLPQAKLTTESIYCECGSQLKYDKIFYANIGHYHCNCGYKRKTPDFSATAEVHHDKTLLKVNYDNNTFNFVIHLAGIYNAYNALAAISMGLLLNIDPTDIQNALNTFHSMSGRAEKVQILGKSAFIQLIKNPVGASEAIRIARADDKSNLIIMINDEYADGRDISWLWDTDFEALSNYKGSITVSGKRAQDIAIRLKYAGFNTSKITIKPDVQEAVLHALSNTKENEQLHILPCYSALMTLQNVLKKL